MRNPDRTMRAIGSILGFPEGLDGLGITETDVADETAAALPPADYDQRTLDAVDRVLVDRIQHTKFREQARTLNLARAAITRELGGQS